MEATLRWKKMEEVRALLPCTSFYDFDAIDRAYISDRERSIFNRIKKESLASNDVDAVIKAIICKKLEDLKPENQELKVCQEEIRLLIQKIDRAYISDRGNRINRIKKESLASNDVDAVIKAIICKKLEDLKQEKQELKVCQEENRLLIQKLNQQHQEQTEINQEIDCYRTCLNSTNQQVMVLQERQCFLLEEISQLNDEKAKETRRRHRAEELSSWKDDEIDELMTENRRLKEKPLTHLYLANYCTICQDENKKATRIFYDCNHAVVCEDCFQQVIEIGGSRNCPYCGIPFRAIISINEI